MVVGKRIFFGSVAETFLEGLAARIATGEREPDVLVFEAVRLLIAHGQGVYGEVIEYGQRQECESTVSYLGRKREALQRLDAVIAGLLRDRSAPITWPDGSAATESGRDDRMRE